jgi:hypothetical protein
MALRVAAAPWGHPAPGRSLPLAPERPRDQSASQYSSDLAVQTRERFLQSGQRVGRTLRELSLPGAPTQFARAGAGHLLSAAEAGALGAPHPQTRDPRGEVEPVRALAAGPQWDACTGVARAVTMTGRAASNAERFRGSRPRGQATACKPSRRDGQEPTGHASSLNGRDGATAPGCADRRSLGRHIRPS